MVIDNHVTAETASAGLVGAKSSHHGSTSSRTRKNEQAHELMYVYTTTQNDDLESIGSLTCFTMGVCDENHVATNEGKFDNAYDSEPKPHPVSETKTASTRSEPATTSRVLLRGRFWSRFSVLGALGLCLVVLAISASSVVLFNSRVSSDANQESKGVIKDNAVPKQSSLPTASSPSSGDEFQTSSPVSTPFRIGPANDENLPSILPATTLQPTKAVVGSSIIHAKQSRAPALANVETPSEMDTLLPTTFKQSNVGSTKGPAGLVANSGLTPTKQTTKWPNVQPIATPTQSPMEEVVALRGPSPTQTPVVVPLMLSTLGPTTKNPTNGQLMAPTRNEPTKPPRTAPTKPTIHATNKPRSARTKAPTLKPTAGTATAPTPKPTRSLMSPTKDPSKAPTKAPTKSPTTSAPTTTTTRIPTTPTKAPAFPTTKRPTMSAPTTTTTRIPILAPTSTTLSKTPTVAATKSPTASTTPTKKPTVATTKLPTATPSSSQPHGPHRHLSPTMIGTVEDTAQPTLSAMQASHSGDSTRALTSPPTEVATLL